MQAHMDQRKSQVKKTVENMITTFAEVMGLTKQQVEEVKEKFGAPEGSSNVKRFGRIDTTPPISQKSFKAKPIIGEKRK